MTTPPRVPGVRHRGRDWPSAEIEALAVAWWQALAAGPPAGPRLTAMVLTNEPASVALFAALSALPHPVIALGRDPRAWRSRPAAPEGTRLALTPAQADLAGVARERGFRPVVLDPPRGGGAPPAAFAPLTFPGVVTFTSGSTGAPKPVFKPIAAMHAAVACAAAALGLRPGDGVVGALPLHGSYGVVAVLFTAMVLGGDIGLVEQFDPRAVLALFVLERYRNFPCTPIMVDLLARCPLDGPPPPAPEVVRVSGGRLPVDAFDAFLARFGTVPRPSYGSSEGNVVTIEDRPAAEVRRDGVGRAVAGVELRIGDDPAAPLPPDRPGRVWFRTPAYMGGYGFPPDLERPATRDGWLPTSDVGLLDAAGCLVLVGRVDDAFKTPGGHLIDPAEIAAQVRRHPGVRDAVVLPIARAGGAVVGLVVEAAAPLSPVDLRAHVGAALPAWCQPEALAVVETLPRTPTGKADRDACLALLVPAPGAGGPDPGAAPQRQ